MTKKERELQNLMFAKKTYEVIPTSEMAEKVRHLEKVLAEPLDEWGDEEEWKCFQKINKLNVSDRRLVLVYSILDGSVIKTAKYFQVNRMTITNNLNRIYELLK